MRVSCSNSCRARVEVKSQDQGENNMVQSGGFTRGGDVLMVMGILGSVDIRY